MASTASLGSLRGTDGTFTIPAPSRPRLPPVDPDRPVRTDRPLRDAPLRVVDPALMVDPVLALDRPVSRAVVAIADTGAGALPHTSQYPSTIVPVQPGSAHLPGSATDAAGPPAAERPVTLPPRLSVALPPGLEVAPPPSAVPPAPLGVASLPEAVAVFEPGAVPQTVQYPSSMVPVQPGSVQFMIASPISAR
ncbi:hypothetical protein [Nocardia sp. CDC160]|uniref:hypothetical protein n=1 Tax=Nocardia sp. CDC160 TaxID=3112166 RepID=UPI003FA356C0